MSSPREAGFKRRTRLEAVRDLCRDTVERLDRVIDSDVAEAAGAVIAETIVADGPIPAGDRAAADGYAVRAEDTFDASDRRAATLTIASTADPGAAVPITAGGPIPPNADAVIGTEMVARDGPAIAVREAIAVGENIDPTGEDVADGETVLSEGDRIDAAGIGVLATLGRETVQVYDRPHVAVIPIGDDLVRSAPKRGESIETDGLSVSALVRSWGASAEPHEIVADDHAAIAAAITHHRGADLVVTTGGSSIGEDDLVPMVIADEGDLLVHGIAIRPGHTAGMGLVGETPILMLPGPPVSCLVAATQVARPMVRMIGHRQPDPPRESTGSLVEKVVSEPGVRSFVPVQSRTEADGIRIHPIPSGDQGRLSGVSGADGWVVIPESREGHEVGETVPVEHWRWCP